MFSLEAIGHVQSSLTDLDAAPRQADEGAPEAWLVLNASVGDGLRGIRAGDEIIALTWLDRARRDLLVVHPRGDTSRPQEGVFNTRSPHRPNPIGLHQLQVTEVQPLRLRVSGLEAIDGTPIIDIKPVLASEIGRR